MARMQVVMMDPGNFTPHYVANLCAALEEQDCQVELVTWAPYFEAVPQPGAYKVSCRFFRLASERLGRSRLLRRQAWLRKSIKALSYPAGLWRTWRALKDRPPGVLHVQWALLPLLDILLFSALRRRGWRIVYTAHEVFPENWTFRRLVQAADAVIAHTAGLARKVVDGSGVAPEKVHVITHGNLGVFRAPDVNPSEARRVLGLSPEGPLLLFYGLIRPYKGLQYLLEAIPLVRQEFPQAHLLIAGQPMQRFSGYQKLIDGLGIAGSVTLRLQYVPLAEVHYYFCAAGLVVLPYVRCSLSGILTMAFGYARPVVATSVGGLPEAIEEGQTGYIVPPRSPEALAQAICRGLRQPALLEQMGREGRRWQQEVCSWSRVARQTRQLYEPHSQPVLKPGFPR